jgi:hypothetical protein
MINIAVKGLYEVDIRLSSIAANSGRLKQCLTNIGQMLRADFTTNMTKGIDPNGHKLTPIAKWTRVAGSGAGASRSQAAMTPLKNTGALRNSIGTESVTNTTLRFGFAAPMKAIAERMYYGVAGRMHVREEKIRSSGSKRSRWKPGTCKAYKLGTSGRKIARTGNKYIRIEVAPGQWITKAVAADNTIAIKPRARKFFFLSDKQVDLIEKRVAVFVDGKKN